MKTTKDHLEAFNRHLVDEKAKLGISGWVLHKAKLANISPAAATISMSFADQQATVLLGRTMTEEELSDDGLKDTAVHELLHLALNTYGKASAALALAMQARIISEADPETDAAIIYATIAAETAAEQRLEAEEHRLIHQLVEWKTKQ